MLGTEFTLVDESQVVKHRCGHSVFWELLPGIEADLLRPMSKDDCPCCKSEQGLLIRGDLSKVVLEWPDHALAAGIGLAHCHTRQLSCKDVDASHRQGMALPDHLRHGRRW